MSRQELEALKARFERVEEAAAWLGMSVLRNGDEAALLPVGYAVMHPVPWLPLATVEALLFGPKLFDATVERRGRQRRKFLIKAVTMEEARDKFLRLAAREQEDGEPLFLFGDEVSYGVVEFEVGDVVEV